MRTKLLWRIIPAVLAWIGVAQAEGVRMYQPGEVPDAGEIANMLRGGAPAAAHKPKMRGIALDPAYQKPATTQVPSSVRHAPEPPMEDAAAAPTEGAFALPVRFSYNSAEILPDATPQLDAVAEGIKLVPDARVVIEGHTDAAGSDAYNQRLSYKRASAVKQYLVYRHGIGSRQLMVEGKGESEPLDPANPYAPENRRVQFRPIH